MTLSIPASWSYERDDIEYLPLDPTEDEIRLLQIDCSEERRHRLIPKVALRKGRQRFIALSYPWGDGPVSATLNIDGKDVKISRNLLLAVRATISFWSRTHGLDGPRLLLWCDQICINQSSNEEKNHQVGFMSEIYRRADIVLIWLPLAPGVSAGFKEWQRWKAWHEQRIRGSQLQEAYAQPDAMMYVKGAQGDPTLKAWMNIKAIVESSWWSRAWVYQEFMLATTAIFLVNGIAVPWLELRDILSKYFDGLADYNQTLDLIRTDHERQIQETEAVVTRMTDRQVELNHRVANLDKGYKARCYGWHHGARDKIRSRWVPSGYPLIHGVKFMWQQTVTNLPYCNCGDHLLICIGVPFFFFVVWSQLLVFVYAIIVNILYCVWMSLVFCMTLPWRENGESLREAHTEWEKSVVVSRSQVDRIRNNLDEYIEKHRKSMNDAKKSWDVARFILASKSETANGSPITLSKLVKHARNCNCTDSRDKIFAFLGLADPAYGIAADYRSTNTLNNVLTEATMAMIKTENSLSVLNDAMEIDAHPQVADHLPSWVPNFTRPDRFNSEYYHFIAGIRLPVDCHASGDLKPVVEFCEDRNGNRNRILKCRGKRVCHLTRMIPDSDYNKPWTRFETEDGMAIETARAARVDDEIWILFGADVPFCLSKPSPKDPYYQLIGQAMLWEHDQRSDILNGSLIDGQDGSYEEICIV